MSRCEPNARGRLELAALELFGERGFEQTTVAQIAERAGLTERTFFRYYADKREVLFPSSSALEQAFRDAVAAAPEAANAIDTVASALESISALLQQRHETARARYRAINANAELQERELIKLSALGDILAGALRQRGVPELSANLAAEVAIAAFKVGFRRWASEAEEGDLARLIRDSLDELRSVAAGR